MLKIILYSILAAGLTGVEVALINTAFRVDNHFDKALFAAAAFIVWIAGAVYFIWVLRKNVK